MKLYVGNLPFSFTEDDLDDLFSEYTVTSRQLIIDRATGKSKGFGFVELASKEDGESAIDALNEKQVGGRGIIVNEARPQEKRENRSFGGNNKRRY